MIRSLGAVLLAAALLAPSPALSWGKKGHRTVGAIADLILEKHPSTRDRVRAILTTAIESEPGGERPTLHDAALWADCVKGACGPLKRWMTEYKDANEIHDRYHYTDIPLDQPKYASGQAGRKPYDVVQVINYAVSVLRGTPDPKGTTADFDEPQALWILAHLVGDIHQPLHVGAIYFDETCKNPVDPNVTGAGQPNFNIGRFIAETVGGGKITMLPEGDGLHHFWDDDTVEGAIRLANLNSSSAPKLARWLVDNHATGWETAGDIGGWAEKWADEILPLSKKAHDLLGPIEFDKMTKQPPKVRCTWKANVPATYEDWAAAETQKQLAKAGFRLAAMLRVIYP